MTQLPPELLRAICETPHDDNLRLIAADWWDNEGETEQAEFVRVQIRIAVLDFELMSTDDCQHDSCPGCQERRELRRRERELLAEHKWDWLPDVVREATIFGGGSCEQVAEGLVYIRGFIGSVACSLADWAGVECRHCEMGTLIVPFPDTCRHCHGTGRIGGHGPVIVACQPVTQLVLTDAEHWGIPTNEGTGIVTAEQCGSNYLNWARQQAGLTPLEGTYNGGVNVKGQEKEG